MGRASCKATPIATCTGKANARGQAASAIPSFERLWLTKASSQSYVQAMNQEGKKVLLVAVSATQTDKHQDVAQQLYDFALNNPCTKEDLLDQRKALLGL